MGELNTWSWPILIVSDQLHRDTDEGAWLRQIVDHLTEREACSVIGSHAWGDAHDIVRSREDLGAIVIDWDLHQFGHIRASNQAVRERAPELRQQCDKASVCGTEFVHYVRTRNTQIPIIALLGEEPIGALPADLLHTINETMWKLTDTAEFNAGRIERCYREYAENVLPPFFRELVNYVNEYKFAWHTPGHMGGQAFLRSPAGTALHTFFGEEILRSDLSISVSELGSLLDHSGVTGQAEAYSAKVFGADQTYYVLNGTSTANQIIWRSQIVAGQRQRCLIDRNCHKSLNYAMIITSASPNYLFPLRNPLGMIGPVDVRGVNATDWYAMAAITNSTYDGICYDVGAVAGLLPSTAVGALHFDEAWFGYARFHSLYKNRFAMSLPDTDRLLFASQSTHKVLAALSQASMIHVRLPASIRDDKQRAETFRNRFNESYMMHGSTSPQYTMIASLEVATKMMADNGPVTSTDNIRDAVELRRDVVRLEQEITTGPGEQWFFQMWQPDTVASAEVSINDLTVNPELWRLRPGEAWHGFGDLPDYTMLDPIKLTFLCPGVDAQGRERPDGLGIPAAVVTNFLIGKGIVCEKTDYYSWLLLNTLGTTRGKQGTLLAALLRFKELFDNPDTLLDDVFPDLVAAHPTYAGVSLRQHCADMHAKIRGEDGLLKRLVKLSSVVVNKAVDPVDAYQAIVAGEIETVSLEKVRDQVRSGQPRTAAVMIVPYPPGIPIMMGGEVFDQNSIEILDYLISRQDFEYEFPGYESDIHGIERKHIDPGDGRRPKAYFQTMVVK